MTFFHHFSTAKFKDEILIYFNIITDNLIFSGLLAKCVLIFNSMQKLGLLFQISYHQLRSFNVFGQILHQILNLTIPIHLSNETGIPFIFEFSYWLFLSSLIMQVSYIFLIISNLKKYEKVKFDSFTFPGLWYFKYINLLYIYLFFLPQFSNLCFGVKCYLSTNEKTIQNLSFDEIYGKKCDFFSLPLFVLNFFQILIVFVVQFTHSLLMFNTETQSKNSLAYSFSTFHSLYLLYEILITVLTFSGPYFMIFNIIIFILQCYLVSILLNNHVFHDPNIEKIVIMLLSGEMILVVFFEICLLIESFFNEKSIFCFNIIFLLIYLKTIKIVSEYYEQYIENLLTLEFSEFSEESKIEKKIKMYYFFIMTQEIHQQNIEYKFDDYPSFLIRGFQEFHREHCKFPECLCKNKKEFIYDYSIRGEYMIDKEKPSNNLKNLIYIKHLLMNIYYVYSSNKRKKSIFLRINMAAFLFYQLKNFHKAVVECIDIKLNAHPNFLHEILLARLMRDIDKFQFNLDRNKWDIPEYSILDFAGLMRIEDNYLTLKSNIKSFLINYISFLGGLTQDNPDINELEELSRLLYCERLEIDNIFHKNSRNPVSIRLYMEYLSNLIFSDDLKKPFEKEYLDKLDLILTNQSNGKVFFELELMYNEDSIIVQMGSTKANLGHIIKANEGMAKFCGYSIPELEYANINILMPERIAEKHDNYLLTFMETSKGKIIYRERKIFARNKSGFIQFSSILTKPLYDYTHDIYKFVAYMQPFSSGIEFAVTDENGFIDSISKGLGTICNMTPDAFEGKRLLIQSIVPCLADIFIDKQLTPELKQQQPKLIQLMDTMKSCKLDNGEFICKAYPYLDGVEDFRTLIDKIGGKIQKKEYKGLPELMEELIHYKETIEIAIPNSCTFILQVSLLILYSQDKSLEMNVFCFKEVDSIYLEIPQSIYGENSNIFKNLDYFLQMKQALGKKRSTRSLSKQELNRMGTMSFYNTNTAKSLYLIDNDFENLPSDIYDESDDISIHMNKKLDKIFSKVKSKKHIDYKLQMVGNTSMKTKSKHKTVRKGDYNNEWNEFSGQIIDLEENYEANDFENVIEKIDPSNDIASLNSQINNKDKNPKATMKIERNEIHNQDEEEIGDEENSNFDDHKEEEARNEEKQQDLDEEGRDQVDMNLSLAPSLGGVKSFYSSTNSIKNNPSKTMKSVTFKAKKIESTFNTTTSFNKTKFSRKNRKLTFNTNNLLEIDDPSPTKQNKESEHELNRMKDKQCEVVKKQNNMLFHDGMGSSVGSSNATNIQARKNLRESINFDYVPEAFKKILWLFSLSAILIFISQAVSTICFQYSIQSLEVSKNGDQNYNEITFYMMRISNSFYKILLIQENLLYTDFSLEQKNGVFDDLITLVAEDSNRLIENVKYLESNYNYLNGIDYEIYDHVLALNLINNTIHLKLLKSIYLFLTNSLKLVKQSLSSMKINNTNVYYILRNINKFVSFFESHENFDSENSNIVYSLKQLMLTIFGLSCGVLFVMFLLRMVLYKMCYNYINNLFLMLGSVPNEDLRTLQNYLKSMKVIFDNILSLSAKNLKNEKEQEVSCVIDLDEVNHNKMWQSKGSDADLKNQRSVFQRRTKFFKNLKFPLRKIGLINLIWYMVFFCGYIGLLGFANIFDNQLDISLKKRVFIRTEQYFYPAKALLYSMDYVFLKTKVMNNSFLDITVNNYFEYLNVLLPTKLVDFSLSSSNIAELYAVMRNTSVCLSIPTNQSKGSRFFSKEYCNGLLNGRLNIGVMPFLKDFSTCLAQINFETSNFSRSDIMTYLNRIQFTEFSEGLEYIIWPLFNYNADYRKSEDLEFSGKITQINTFIILELVSILLLVIIYWFFYLRPLKKRLIYGRKCFFHIPFAMINQNVKILKYINTTGNLLMKTK